MRRPATGRVAALLGALLGMATAAPTGDAGAGALFTAAFSTPEGRTDGLGTLRGRPLIVNFWARWCTPCRAEIPELARIQRERPDVVVIGIDVDEDPAAVREFAAAYEMRFRVLVTRGDGVDLLRALGNPAASLPFTLAIDGGGAIVARRLGVLRPGDLDVLLRALR
jgi:thiol-disulfide isomerase/thioredoxin